MASGRGLVLPKTKRVIKGLDLWARLSSGKRGHLQIEFNHVASDLIKTLDMDSVDSVKCAGL